MTITSRTVGANVARGHHPRCNLANGHPGPCAVWAAGLGNREDRWDVLTTADGARVYPGATLVATLTVPAAAPRFAQPPRATATSPAPFTSPTFDGYVDGLA